jgi:hypothetical protein
LHGLCRMESAKVGNTTGTRHFNQDLGADGVPQAGQGRGHAGLNLPRFR